MKTGKQAFVSGIDASGRMWSNVAMVMRRYLKVDPGALPGKVTLSATQSGDKIRVWSTVNRTDKITLPKTWASGQAIPGVLYVEGVTNSVTARDVELKLEYDENPAGQSNSLFKCTDIICLTVLKIEIDYPYDTNGNGKIDDPDNELSFDAGSPALLQILCQAFNSPGSDPDKFRWKIEDIGAIKGVWDPHVADDVYTGKGLSATVTFKGMPKHNADFGRKKITLNYEGLSCSDEEYVEVFFEPLGLNNPGPPPQNPPSEISEVDLVE